MKICVRCQKVSVDEKHNLCRECVRELWKKAQQTAIKNYEEEWGEGSWDEADKYEREDCVFYEYGLLLMEFGVKIGGE